MIDRNPHFPGLKKVLARFLDRYVEHEKPKRIRVLDLAAGSGEATIVRCFFLPFLFTFLLRMLICAGEQAINDWYNTRWPSAPLSSSSPPPHAPTPSSAPALSSSAAAPPPPSLRIRQPFIPPSLRAAVTRPTPSSGLPPPPKPLLSIVASDPFTAAAYKQRTGGECLELGWAEVTKGELPPSPPGCSVGTRTGGDGEEEEKEEEEKEEEDDGLYDIVVVSFALHLVETTSELWALLSELSKRARWLVVTVRFCPSPLSSFLLPPLPASLSSPLLLPSPPIFPRPHGSSTHASSSPGAA